MARKTNVQKHGKYDYFRVTITSGFDDTGKRIRKEFNGHSKADAEARKDKYLEDKKSGLNIDMANMSLSRAMHMWLFEIKKKSGLKDTTFMRYEGVYRNYIKSSKLGMLPVSEIERIHVNRFLNDLEKNNPMLEEKKMQNQIKQLEEKKHQLETRKLELKKHPNPNERKLIGKKITRLNKTLLQLKDLQSAKAGENGCTHYQMKNVIKVLKNFFNFATNEGYTLRNPILRITVPGEKPAKEEVETFSDDEIEKIKAALVGHRLRLIVLLGLGTGLRRGELCARKYSDIESGYVDVDTSLAQITVIDDEGNKKREFRIWETKTNNSRRQVPIPEELQKEISLHRAKQIAERMAQGIGGEPEYIFTTESGKLYDQSNFAKSWSRLLKKAGVPYKKFHTLRHTYATRLIQAGVPIVTVSKLLGHSSIYVTQIYTHARLDDKVEAVKALNYLFK